MDNTFRTLVKPQPAPFPTSHGDRLLLVGSCFTQHIGRRLEDAKFTVQSNPFGIVYNPVSIARCLERLWVGNRPFEAAELFDNAGLWRSWEHHSDFAETTMQAALERINGHYSRDAVFLRNATRLILTFGTAEVFELNSTDQVVANNHKMPSSLFRERRLTVDEIARDISDILQKIKSENADIQVILTVSPVRHLRNGAMANQRSKATLVLACDEICRQLQFVHYFPAYELLLDDLRDYRFYAADMTHPSEPAVDYIWNHFSESCFLPATIQLLEGLEKIRRAMQHRPFHPDTPEHRQFKQKQLAAVLQLEKQYPELDWKAERDYFMS